MLTPGIEKEYSWAPAAFRAVGEGIDVQESGGQANEMKIHEPDVMNRPFFSASSAAFLCALRG